MISTRFIGVLAAFTIAASVGAQIITQPIPQAAIVPGPAVIGFVDLSTNGGIQLTGVGDDSEHNIVTTIGNGMFPAGNVRIGNNGVAVAGITTGEIEYTNLAIPMVLIPNLIPPSSWVPTGIPQTAVSAILAFWDDLLPGPGTSIWWKEADGVLYIMWKGEYHFNSTLAGQTITFEIQVFGSPAFGAPWIQLLYPDAAFGGTMAANDNGASATVGVIEGTSSPAIGGNGQWSFNTVSILGGMVLSIRPPQMTLTATSPSGPGSIQLTVRRAPPGGTYFVAGTGYAGAYPNGWLYGLDIPFPELLSELSTGAPFIGPVNDFTMLASGNATIGPFTGAPSGLTIYAIAFGGFPGATGPAIVSQPMSYTIP